ncbi:hypothetical protein BJV82DRAFT_637180 [Fennellomyces sp. T-0311]|nr:hypothetical protein BJV82DRAFT_637180 [Fennellomyces sp. T-0311]
MSDSLDMSTASIVSRNLTDSLHNSSSEPGSSIPSLPSPPSPRSLIGVVEAEQQEVPYPPPPKDEDVTEPLTPPQPITHHSRLSFILSGIRSVLGRVANFVFKDNNLPLLLNVIYHLAAARSLIAQPWQIVNRYIKVPVIKQEQHKPVLAAANLATDALRAIGAMHAALGLLAALALKERRVNTERSALLVLTLASVGQTWAHASAYWNSKYSIRALQEVGSLDSLVFLVSGIALVKTVRRTGRLL